jgi:hypothetical protein
MMRGRLLPSIDAELMDGVLLNEDKRTRLFSSNQILAMGIDYIQAWMVARARYQFVTTELVDWLKARIGTRSVIEVGAGMGDLGYHLGIRMTDSCIQTQMKAEYTVQMEALRQAPTVPPADVECIDAEAAVAKYKPEVVVASWITQKHHAGDPDGFEFGPEEIRIVRQVQQYIVVGNSGPHSSKRIRRLKHREFKFPWLVSRGVDQQKNVIYVWGK